MKLKNFFLGAVLFIVGLLMAIAPDSLFKIIIVLIGATIVVSGVYNLMFYYKISDDVWFKKTMLIKSLVGIGIGLLAVICPLAIVNGIKTVLTVMCFILSVSSLLFAVGSFASASKLEDAAAKKRFTVEGLIYIAIAVILFIFGFGNLGTRIVQLLGIIAAIVGVIMIVLQALLIKKNAPEKAEVVSVVDEDSDKVESKTKKSEKSEKEDE